MKPFLELLAGLAAVLTVITGVVALMHHTGSTGGGARSPRLVGQPGPSSPEAQGPEVGVRHIEFDVSGPCTTTIHADGYVRYLPQQGRGAVVLGAMLPLHNPSVNAPVSGEEAQAQLRYGRIGWARTPVFVDAGVAWSATLSIRGTVRQVFEIEAEYEKKPHDLTGGAVRVSKACGGSTKDANPQPLVPAPNPGGNGSPIVTADQPTVDRR